MTQTIHLGISTCPNDTFAFHALLNDEVDLRGLQFQTELQDVQQLNDRLLGGDFDVAKTSFHAALLMTEQTVVLPSGSALGFGVGPLLLSQHPEMDPDRFRSLKHSPVVQCPGATTTATLLYKMFYPGECQMQQVVFSEIMPALKRAEADFGVCIHEGRFTWQQSGLYRVADLGELWESKTAVGLPLGGIVARSRLGDSTIAKVQAVIRDSIEFGLANREATLSTMRKYAAEFQDSVLFAHVDLYVNKTTLDLGEEGLASLAAFSKLAEEAGVENVGKLEVFQ